MDFGNQEHLDPETLEHLVNEVPGSIKELYEMNEIIGRLTGKADRRMQKAKRHMMQCGTCLSRQMANGALIPIEHYWAAGGFPKLHQMLN